MQRCRPAHVDFAQRPSARRQSPNASLRIIALFGIIGILNSIPSAMTSHAQESPTIIAHRGASGYLPEHTLAAYALGHAQGADYVEQDLVLTRDRQLICLHDIHLEATTDVEQRFPDRSRADGRFYAIDFTLAEIKTLRVHERLPNRFPQSTLLFTVPTFSEAIVLIQGLNQSTQKNTGIYPELKGPSFHRDAGAPIEDVFVATLRKHGYGKPTDRIFVQSFELSCLERLKNEFQLPHPLIFLIGGDQEDAVWFGPAELAKLSPWLAGLGPSKRLIQRHPEIVARAQASGLVIHPYTFRADDRFPMDEFETFTQEVQWYVKTAGVDGLFTDFPDQAQVALD